MIEEKKMEDLTAPEGCYLVFESAFGGRLMLYYSKDRIPKNAVGFWCAGPGKKIQGFKFKQNEGRVELIRGIAGGDQNRRKYFSGWCQFIKLAKAFDGYVIKFPNSEQGVEVDVYGFQNNGEKACDLDLDAGLIEVGALDAVAAVPKHNTALRGIQKIPLQLFLESGNKSGASTTF